MKKFTTILKNIPFQLTTAEGEVELKFTEFSIGDVSRLIELQRPLIDGDGTGSLNDLYRTRVMCSVKRADTDEYYWPLGINSFNNSGLPAALVEQLIECVNELNPIPEIEESVNTKKNDS